jgi:hypothetical protein
MLVKAIDFRDRWGFDELHIGLMNANHPNDKRGPWMVWKIGGRVGDMKSEAIMGEGEIPPPTEALIDAFCKRLIWAIRHPGH